MSAESDLRALLALPPSTRVSDEEDWLRTHGPAVLALLDAAQAVTSINLEDGSMPNSEWADKSVRANGALAAAVERLTSAAASDGSVGSAHTDARDGSA